MHRGAVLVRWLTGRARKNAEVFDIGPAQGGGGGGASIDGGPVPILGLRARCEGPHGGLGPEVVVAGRIAGVVAERMAEQMAERIEELTGELMAELK